MKTKSKSAVVKLVAALVVSIGALLAAPRDAAAQDVGPCVVGGMVIPEIADPHLNDGAYATFRTVRTPGGPRRVPVILYNPAIIAGLMPVTRQFVKAHECGHHQLGHFLRGNTGTMEQESDCFAMRVLADQPWFNQVRFDELRFDLMRNANMGDATHHPTVVRVNLLPRCLAR